MFTGITRGTYPIVALERRDDLLRYTVELSRELAQGVELGASVAIDGVCQTVVRIEDAEDAGDARRLTFEAIVETLEKTTLGELEVGSRASVERSLRAGDEIGGHEVAGHVHGTGTIDTVRRDGNEVALRIAVPAGWRRYLQPKGFVAVDGSSLTVGDVLGPEDLEESDSAAFWIYLIPETLRLTRLGEKTEGARVNIELDSGTVTLVDTVERVVAERLRHVLDPDQDSPLRETVIELIRRQTANRA